jgi:hypothetical protein
MIFLNKCGRTACHGVWLLGLGIALGFPLIVFLQCREWLKTGAWHPYAVRMIWDESGLVWPHAEWVGVQKLIDSLRETLFSAPLSIAMGLAGGAICLFGFVGYWFFDEAVYTAGKGK